MTDLISRYGIEAVKFMQMSLERQQVAENIEIQETKANNMKGKVQEAKVATTKPAVEERKSKLADKTQPQEMDRSSGVQISGGSKQSNGSGNAQHERRGR